MSVPYPSLLDKRNRCASADSSEMSAMQFKSGKEFTMKRFEVVLLGAGFAANMAIMQAQQLKYPPMSEYMMRQEEEIALAKSAAPGDISNRAAIEVLTSAGYRV